MIMQISVFVQQFWQHLLDNWLLLVLVIVVAVPILIGHHREFNRR